MVQTRRTRLGVPVSTRTLGENYSPAAQTCLSLHPEHVLDQALLLTWLLFLSPGFADSLCLAFPEFSALFHQLPWTFCSTPVPSQAVSSVSPFSFLTYSQDFSCILHVKVHYVSSDFEQPKEPRRDLSSWNLLPGSKLIFTIIIHVLGLAEVPFYPFWFKSDLYTAK